LKGYLPILLVCFAFLAVKVDAAPCIPGTSSPTGNDPCTNCDVGTFAEQIGSTSCQPCPAGKFVNTTGANSCILCQHGKYTATTGQTACTDCSPGTYAVDPGSSHCTLCPSGTFQDNGGATSCPACPSGLNSGEGQNRCTTCPAGTPCSTCGAGQYESGSDTCADCPEGTAAAAGDGACTACSAGYFSSTTQATSCSACAAGTYNPGPGMLSCLNCAAGSDTLAGQTTCELCPAGKYAAFAGDICSSCDAGTYIDSTGTTACLACPSEKWSFAGAQVCVESAREVPRSVAGCSAARPPSTARGLDIFWICFSLLVLFQLFAGLRDRVFRTLLVTSLLSAALLPTAAQAEDELVKPPVLQASFGGVLGTITNSNTENRLVGSLGIQGRHFYKDEWGFLLGLKYQPRGYSVSGRNSSAPFLDLIPGIFWAPHWGKGSTLVFAPIFAIPLGVQSGDLPLVFSGNSRTDIGIYLALEHEWKIDKKWSVGGRLWGARGFRSIVDSGLRQSFVELGAAFMLGYHFSENLGTPTAE